MKNLLNDPGHAAKKIADFLVVLSTTGGLNLKSHILACNGQVQPDSSDPAGEPSAAATQVPSSPAPPRITVEFTGPDTPLLLARNAELLHAIEHVAAKILRLEPEEHDRISFDAERFKANRDRDLRQAAEAAIAQVRAQGRPYSFAPMSSRERRLVHLAVGPSGLR